MDIPSLTEAFKLASDMKETALHFKGDNFDVLVKPILSKSEPMIKAIFKF